MYKFANSNVTKSQSLPRSRLLNTLYLYVMLTGRRGRQHGDIVWRGLRNQGKISIPAVVRDCFDDEDETDGSEVTICASEETVNGRNASRKVFLEKESKESWQGCQMRPPTTTAMAKQGYVRLHRGSQGSSKGRPKASPIKYRFLPTYFVDIGSIIALFIILAWTIQHATAASAGEALPFHAGTEAKLAEMQERENFGIPTVGEETKVERGDKAQPLASVSVRERQLTAYDCTEPHDIHAVSLLQDADIRRCEKQRLKEKQREATYLLLQRAHRVKVKVQHCKVLNSRLSYVCGSASHSAIANRETYFMRPWKISPSECAEMWRTQKYMLWTFPGKRDERRLTLNAINFLTFVRTGYTQNTITDVGCYGGRFPAKQMLSMNRERDDLKGVDMHNFIVTDYVEIAMYERDAYITLPMAGQERKVIVPRFAGELPCKYDEGKCQVEEGIFLWKDFNEEELCPYFTLKRTTGINLPPESGSEDAGFGETFLAENNTMLRVRKKGGPISECGAVLQPTEHQDLFLTTDLEHAMLSRPIPPSEVSPYLHATVSDNYLYHKSQDNLAAAVLGLQQHQCRQDRQRSLSAYAAQLAKQKAVSDGDTAHLGNGLFMTASGEVAYLYWCRSLTVTALPFPDQCYNAIPVELPDQDQKHLRKILADQDQPPEEVVIPQMFVEPRSRRITTVASPVACVPHFAPMYKNVHSEWIKMTQGSINTAKTPRNPLANMDDSFFEVRKIELPPPGERSIYSRATLMASMMFLAVPNLIMLPKANHRINVQPSPEHGAQTGEGAFPSMTFELPSFPSIWDQLGLGGMIQLIEWYRRYSTFCVVIFGTYILYSLLCYAFHVLTTLCCKPRNHSVLWHIFEAFFPSLSQALFYGSIDKNSQHGPCYNPAKFCLRMRKRYEQGRKNRRSGYGARAEDSDAEREGQRLYPKIPTETNKETVYARVPMTTIRPMEAESATPPSFHTLGLNLGHQESRESLSTGPNVQVRMKHLPVSTGTTSAMVQTNRPSALTSPPLAPPGPTKTTPASGRDTKAHVNVSETRSKFEK